MRTARPDPARLRALYREHGSWVAVLNVLWRPGWKPRTSPAKREAEREAARERAREREARFAEYASEADYARASKLIAERTVS